ncbi:shikimate dehydrogenase family protein [uncultured Sphingomonas sp.]|uniref:shikimate dehydrogenase family protein n=1 Tax=uncultured Sphingomonas sp. TaxID=158754 RepID=UPI0035CA0B99
MTHADVIGDPIAHSKSPLIHRFWLEALAIDAQYNAQRISLDQLSAYITDRIADPAWRGCNVTIPHKVAILDLIPDPGDVRGSIGAANTVFRGADGALIATNTDAAGFVAPIVDLDLAGKPVVVIGAGGAARAILFALARGRVGPVTILNRHPLRGAALLAAFGLTGDVMALGSVLPPAALIVNASPLGMVGQPPLDIDLAGQPDDAVVYDIVYAPLETPFLAQARARGLATVDGLEMLIGQAALAFELFFGATPPRDRDDALRAVLAA